LLDKLKLTLKSGDIVIFDDDVEKLVRQNMVEFGRAQTKGFFTGQEGDYWDSALGFREKTSITLAQDATAAGMEPEFLKSTTQRVQLLQQAATPADNDYMIVCEGGAYLDTVCFDFLKYGLLDAPTLKKVQVGLTAGSTAGVIKIAVSELVTSF
jgi:hypothetical protein